ncbi:TPA: hypothetical protein QC285_003315 [Bacillus cereus]|uniref:hypothetical protein n=1 Tax=Bacillus cereus group TaxID=86661 RepID=UPI00053205A2|nr:MULTISPECIES: hypothetical protein [Bacillus cereus group]KGT43562.1 hypothetical protein IY08_12765 [Bacillus cereus]MED3529296.1 hypothetical protein [Bacillus thuringiensis]PET56851.1 hypothetical protein CN536_23650 [Bacillus cereus]PEY15318.1 hypothetical protein CN331_22275 [Bacillus cereus]PFV05372.1 hypothetical protein COL10_25155 [Bacillus cereus]
MREVSAKEIMLSSLTMSVEAIQSQTDSQQNEGAYFTYVTASGLITGKEMKYDVWEFDKDKDFSDIIKDEYEKKGEINLFSMANASARKLEYNLRDDDTVVKDQGKSIVLEDVTIDKTDGSSPIKTNAFVLFLDQVIGIIPARIK